MLTQARAEIRRALTPTEFLSWIARLALAIQEDKPRVLEDWIAEVVQRALAPERRRRLALRLALIREVAVSNSFSNPKRRPLK